MSVTYHSKDAGCCMTLGHKIEQHKGLLIGDPPSVENVSQPSGSMHDALDVRTQH